MDNSFVQDAETFQLMVDELDHRRFMAAMKESEAAVLSGEIEELDLAFAKNRCDLGLTDSQCS